MSLFKIGSLAAKPGEKVSGHIEAMELVDGSRLPIAVTLINGAAEGPTVFVGGGAHGDEINGVRAVIDAVGRIDPARLKGRIVAVPVQNPLAFRARYRLITFNQLDQQNMHRAFPGSPAGDMASRNCHLILNDIVVEAGCDLVIDCHTGSTGSYYPPLVFVSTIGPDEAVRRSLAAARVFNAPFIIAAGGKAGVYAMGSMLHMVAVERGIPAFGCELGTALPAEARHSDLGAAGIRDVLIHLGMIEGEMGPRRTQIELEEIHEVRSERGGICDYLVSPGDEVAKGQAIARVINLFGETVHEAVSPVDGYVTTCTYWGSINQGERLARVARKPRT